MEFLFSQICGLIVSVAIIASMQFKDIRYALVCLLICNSVGAMSYILLGGLSGCGIYVVALIQTIVYFFFRWKKKNAPSWLVAVFLLLYILCSWSTYKSPVDLLPTAAAICCALALAQEKASRYRNITLINGLIWVVYDVNIGAYTMILAHLATAISAAVGIYRMDIKLLRRKQ